MSNALVKINAYPPQLVIDLAMGVDGTDYILDRYGLDQDELDLLECNPIFRAQLAEARKVVTTEGLSFKQKAKLLAEVHLETLNEMMYDPITPPATKLGVFQALMKGGDLEPKQKETAQGTQPTFALQINLN
jgi:hypothetical protein